MVQLASKICRNHILRVLCSALLQRVGRVCRHFQGWCQGISEMLARTSTAKCGPWMRCPYSGHTSCLMAGGTIMVETRGVFQVRAVGSCHIPSKQAQLKGKQHMETLARACMHSPDVFLNKTGLQYYPMADAWLRGTTSVCGLPQAPLSPKRVGTLLMHGWATPPARLRTLQRGQTGACGEQPLLCTWPAMLAIHET